MLFSEYITGKRRSGKRAGAIYANSPLPTVVAMPWTSPLQARREPRRRHAAIRIYKNTQFRTFGCKIGCRYCNSLIISIVCGEDEIRTRGRIAPTSV